MHRQHPHFVPGRLFEVPLDFGLRAAEPRNEALERRRVLAPVIEGEREKLVDRVFRVGAEPGDDPLAPAQRPQDAAEELVGRHEVGHPEHFVDQTARAVVARIALPARERGGQGRLAAAVSEVEQRRLAEPRQRPLEDRGEGEIVVHHQRRLGQREQVHHRELGRQHQAVDPGHADGSLLEGADEMVDEFAALAHQHHDVARAYGPLPGFQPLAVPDPALDPGGDRLGQAVRRGLVGERLVDGQPRIDLDGLAGPGRRPELDPPRLSDPAGGVGHRPVPQPAPGIAVGEHRVDGAQHRRRGAEGMAELDSFPGRAGVQDTGAKLLPHRRERARLDALEAVDRLFGIAHREERASALFRALAGEEIRRQRPDDRPLAGIGVLRLVDQHVIDPAVQLVEHPESRRLVFDQPLHARDQVVVVEPPLARLLLAIGREQRGADAREGSALGGSRGGEKAFPDRPDALRLRLPGFRRLGRGGRHGLGGKVLPDVALLRQEGARA